MNAVQDLLPRLIDRHDLTEPEAEAAVSAIMDGACAPAEIAAFLTALRMKGEAISEIVGAARAMRARATPILTHHQRLLDTCGTGGDQLHTFNISTATAFVVAAAGVVVPKHGNRGVSSRSGSADVLEQLGVDIQLRPEQVTQCLDSLGIGFCFAPLIHGAMQHAAPVRRLLKFRTIFNLLGPLTNPAGAQFQLVGASRVHTAEQLAEALLRLGRERALVVCGADELDEVSLWGETTVFEVCPGHIKRYTWTAASLGLPECQVGDLQVADAPASAQRIRDLLEGTRGPCRDIVVANSAAAFLAAGECGDLRDGVLLAERAIDSGTARQLLHSLQEMTTRLARNGA